MKFSTILTILSLSIITSCRNERSGDARIDQRSEGTSHPILVVRPDDEDPERSEIFSFVAMLEEPGKMRSLEDVAILIDERSGQKYEVPYFGEILGVRSSNETRYEVKLYKDNSLYGINPIYPEAGHPALVPEPEDGDDVQPGLDGRTR